MMTMFHFHSERGASEAGFVALIVGVVAAVIVMFVLMFSVTYESVPPDKIGLHYTGGPLDGTKFVEVIQPGTGNQMYGLSEKVYRLPSTQRTYSVKRDGSGDLKKPDSVSAPSKDEVPFTFEADVQFFLNRDPKVLRQFFEDVCLHNKCWDLDNEVTDDNGWRQMLHARLRPQLENAIAQASKKFDATDLYNDPDTLLAMNREVSAILSKNVNENLGGPYFCGVGDKTKCADFRVVISNPLPPKSTLDSLAATAAAKQDKIKAQEQAEAGIITAQGEADANRIKAEERSAMPTLTPEQIRYIEAQALLACAQNPECTLVVTPSGSGVNVNTGG